MQFNSFAFLGFFAVLTGLYYVLPARWRWVLLLVASYWFYSQFQLVYVLLLAYSTLVAYAAGLALQRRASKAVMWLGVGLELAVLVLFKYVDFLAGLLEVLLRRSLPPRRWRYRGSAGCCRPASFFVFSTVSYIVDVQRRTIPAERHLGHLALYVAFFPADRRSDRARRGVPRPAQGRYSFQPPL